MILSPVAASYVTATWCQFPSARLRSSEYADKPFPFKVWLIPLLPFTSRELFSVLLLKVFQLMIPRESVWLGRIQASTVNDDAPVGTSSLSLMVIWSSSPSNVIALSVCTQRQLWSDLSVKSLSISSPGWTEMDSVKVAKSPSVTTSLIWGAMGVVLLWRAWFGIRFP